MSEQQLVQVSNAAAAIIHGQPFEDLTGLSTVVRTKPTNLTLVQPMTREPKTARPGQFLDELNGDVFDKVTFVPLRVSTPRVHYVPGAPFGTPPLCRSNDGLVPSPRVATPQHHECGHKDSNGRMIHTCPKAKWYGKNKPPCSNGLKLLGIIKESAAPRYLSLNAMSIRPLMDALNSIAQDIDKFAFQNKLEPRLSLYDYFFTLKSDKVQNGKGLFYVAEVHDIKRVANTDEFGPYFQQFVVQAQQFMAQDDEDVKDAAVTDSVGNAFGAEEAPATI